MSELITAPNLNDVDDIYEKLVALQEGRSEVECLKIWSKLVLILVNHIGDSEVIGQAIAMARPRADT